jgi:hypothetical protein
MVISEQALRGIFEAEERVIQAINTLPALLSKTLRDVEYELEWGLLDLHKQGLDSERPAAIIWVLDTPSEELYLTLIKKLTQLQTRAVEDIGGITLDLRFSPEIERSNNDENCED